jgi:3-isopropylmalate/(R)-2-methylmalate dehydratase large subunit
MIAIGVGGADAVDVMTGFPFNVRWPKVIGVRLTGSLSGWSSPKDVILEVARILTVEGGTGAIVEYHGPGADTISATGKATICNMGAEIGATCSVFPYDENMALYLKATGREAIADAADRVREHLRPDDGATYDRLVEIDVRTVAPQVTWGTNPGMVAPITGRVPHPNDFPTDQERQAAQRALEYMGLLPGTPLEGIPVDRVFLGSCTNARIEDLRSAARVVEGRRVAPGVRALVVPGSQRVKAQAEAEGLDRVFVEAGFEWRNAGCSMCLGMNADVLKSGERCASTSNRNFEGRQGRGGRTHLMSPPMAAAAAVAGRLVDVRGWEERGEGA